MQDGWIFGPDLIATHDGGLTWEDETRKEAILGLEAQGDTVWAIEDGCTAGPACYTLLTTSVRGSSWVPAPVQPVIVGSWAQFLRPSENDAWIFSAEFNGNGGHLIATHDGGKSWQTLASTPCIPLGAAHMTALANGQLWFFCGGQPGAGQQDKAVFMSPDGGQHWGMVATSENTNGTLGHLDFGGYVNGIGANAPDTVFTVTYRGSALMRSTDAGHTWDAVPMQLSDMGIGPIKFLDAKHGWITFYNHIARTTDGGTTWETADVNTP